jgi:methylamine--corrinoid protein Co-methyltransferase
MLSFIDIIKRAEEGPKVDEKEFDLKWVYNNVKELVKEYDIKYNPEELIVTSEDFINNVFEAGFQLALRTGIYVVEYRSVIKFSEEEIKEGIKTAPAQLVVGEGADSRILYSRKIEDQRAPFIMGGHAGAPYPDDLYFVSALSYMQEPIIDGINHGGIAVVNGLDVRTRSPLEALAAIKELMYLREAARIAGRPGIHLLAAESGVTAIGDLAAINSEYGLRKTDAHLVPVLNEMKTDWDRLIKAIVFKIRGGINCSLVDPVIGGFFGGPAGVAIGFIASFLLSRLVYQADYYIIHPIHNKWVSTSVPEGLWVLSTVGQAMSKHTNFILMGDVWTSNGAGSQEIFWETVANTITNVVTGSHPLGVSATNGKYPHASGLETRFMGEVAHASIKLSRREANEIVKTFLKKYHPEKTEKPNIGKPNYELYDVKTMRPRDWWLNIYKQAVKEVAEYGIKIT